MGMRSVFFLFEMLDCSKTWHSSCNKGGLSFNCALRWRQVVPFATCNRFSKLKPSSIYLQHVPANTTTGALVGTKEEIYLHTKRYMPRCSSYPESDTLDKYVDLRSIENSYRWKNNGKNDGFCLKPRGSETHTSTHSLRFLVNNFPTAHPMMDSFASDTAQVSFKRQLISNPPLIWASRGAQLNFPSKWHPGDLPPFI